MLLAPGESVYLWPLTWLKAGAGSWIVLDVFTGDQREFETEAAAKEYINERNDDENQ